MQEEQSPEQPSTERQRREYLLFWGPLGLLLFAVGPAYLISFTWGFANPFVIAGALCGLVPVAVLARFVVRRWRRPLTASQLRRSRRTYAGMRSSGLIGAAAAVGVALNAAFGIFGGAPFPTAFLWTFAGGSALLAYPIAFARKGLYQPTPPPPRRRRRT